MSVTEIRKVCHLLLDQIQDKETLEEFLQTLKGKQEGTGNDFWNELSEEQKKDLEDAWLESEDESNLISHDEVMKLSREWLKK